MFSIYSLSKKALFTVCFVIFFNEIKAQSKIDFEFNIEPTFISSCLQKTKDMIPDINIGTANYLSERKSADHFKSGRNIGVLLNYHATDRLTEKIGLRLSVQHFTQGTYLPNYAYIVYNNIIYFYGFSNYSATCYYLGIPLGTQYAFYKGKKFDIGADFFLEPCCLLSADDLMKNQEKWNAAYNRFVLEGNAGIYINYHFTHTYSASIKPDFGYSLTPNIVNFSSVRQYNYYFGVTIGFVINKNIL